MLARPGEPASHRGAGWEAITRFFHPVDIRNAWLLIIAGLIGFAGNEIVAIYRIRVGRSIGSAALMADGVHARLDGFTSLSVVAGAIFVLFGLPIADPVIGLLIAISILILLWGTVRSIGRRLMDGIEPELLARAEHALQHVEGVVDVERLQLPERFTAKDVQRAMHGHVLDEVAIYGTYSLNPSVKG